MVHSLQVLFVSTLLVIAISGCSTTSESTSDAKAPASDVPVWFSNTSFTSDSLAFHGYAKAISSDSVIAYANARLQAKSTLEAGIAENLEDVRVAMEEQGNALATNADFIITLRNAHQKVEDQAKNTNNQAVKKEGYFVGYSRVTISRSAFRDMMEDGFRGKSSYWNALADSEAFQQLIP